MMRRGRIDTGIVVDDREGAPARGAALARRAPFRRTSLLVRAIALVLVAGVAAAAPPEADDVATGRRGMVVADQRLAAEIGRDVLRDGGNAVDAAVAVAWALAVVAPCCGNVGGGGFLLVHHAAGGQSFLNFRERAPLRATRDMFLDASGEPIPGASLHGWLAVAVPGTVMGLERARVSWGTMSRERLLAPAIRLARAGFPLSAGDVGVLALGNRRFAERPEVASIFLNAGRPWAAGERLVQKDLGATLAAISKDGAEAFYRGEIARRVVAASEAGGGILSTGDFAQYFVEEREPVRCRYRGREIVSAPPPSSGGTAICEALNVLEGFPLGELGAGSAEAVHRIVEAERRAFADRNTKLGDPAFVENPLDELLSPQYAARLRATIEPGRATPSSRFGAPLREGESTTHLSVVDGAGNAVALTYTINAYFGAQVVAPGTGFLLNDEMDDFSKKPGVPNLYGLVEGETNAIAPGKRPLSSMSPTIVLEDGAPVLVAGTPGGSRIITTVLGIVLNVIDFGMPAKRAVDAPRVHHQWLPDAISLEPDALSAETRARLEAMGHAVGVEERSWGAANAIAVDRGRKLLHGANDRRRTNGAAIGW